MESGGRGEVEPHHSRLRESRSRAFLGPQLVDQRHACVTEVDRPRNQRGQFVTGHFGTGRAHVSITTGTPTSVATGVQMSTSWPGVSMETIRL